MTVDAAVPSTIFEMLRSVAPNALLIATAVWSSASVFGSGASSAVVAVAGSPASPPSVTTIVVDSAPAVSVSVTVHSASSGSSVHVTVSPSAIC